MTDNLERLKARDEHLAQWAVAEIEALRQRVKDGEEMRKATILDLEACMTNLAALKAGQGEPICYLREEWLSYEQSAEGQPGAFPVFTSAPSPSSLPALPEGYVLVPVEPTPGMYAAVDNERLAQLYWRKLIAAAPKGESNE